MDNNTLILKVKQALNKLDSQDYDNLECWQIAQAVNKAQLTICRTLLSPKDMRLPGAEGNTQRIVDLQVLITTKSLLLTQKKNCVESELPQNFMHFSRTSVTGNNQNCKSKQFVTYLVPVADVDILLGDVDTKPNWDWAETICTLGGNKLTIYTEDFSVKNASLIYYRYPREVSFEGCPHPNGSIPGNITSELPDGLLELIIDEAAAILAGQIESIQQYQINSASVKETI